MRLEKFGRYILRFEDARMKMNIESVVEEIKDWIVKRELSKMASR
jgi:very-short-patch-repair endonuclease